MVSGNFFSGLGVSFTRGRGFALGDETAHASVVVLCYSYWTTRFGRSPSAIGQTIYVKGVPFTVIGVTAHNLLLLLANEWPTKMGRCDLHCGATAE